MEEGEIRITGEQGDSVTFSDLAKMMNGVPGFKLPDGIEAGLETTHYFQPSQAAYANGSHAAEVAVDIETGSVEILPFYVVAHDCGNPINPLIVDGQVQGGVAHGIGNAFVGASPLRRRRQPADHDICRIPITNGRVGAECGNFARKHRPLTTHSA